MPISIVLAGKHRHALSRLSRICHSESDLEVVAQASTGAQALRAVRQWSPDVAVLDMGIENPGPVPVLRRTAGASFGTRYVVLVDTEEDLVFDVMRLGAHGLVPVLLAPALLAKCVREVHAGSKWFERDLATRTIERLCAQGGSRRQANGVLSDRELAVARLAGQGLRNAQIAARLSITEGTTKAHLHRIYEKLRLGGRRGRSPRWALRDYLHANGVQ
jgi:two-component system NarL family response regulator